MDSLKRLQESIDNRKPLSYEEDDSYASEDFSEVSSFVDIDNDINQLTSAGDESTSSTNMESDVLLDYDSQLDIESDTKGPKISEKVATVVNRLSLKRMKKHNTPENIAVRLPKCEQSIWNQIPGHIRVNDVKLQGTQSLLLSSVN